MVKYKLTNVRFTEEEHEALRHLAVSEGRSMADIVREAVSSYLEHKVGRTLTEDELANDPFFKRQRQPGREKNRSSLRSPSSMFSRELA